MKWEIPLDQRLEIVRTAKVQRLENSKPVRVYDERNIIDLTCYSASNGASSVRGVFSVYSRDKGEKVFQLVNQYQADFIIAPDGFFHVKPKQVMPNLRHVPAFADKEVKEGGSWEKNGELVIDDFSLPFKLIFPVTYKLVKIEKKEGNDIAVIDYSYVIDKVMEGQGLPEDFPARIYGKNAGRVFWNITLNRPAYMSDVYQIAFMFSKGGSSGVVEFRMNIETFYKMYTKTTKEQKKKDKEELKKKLPKGGGIDVDTDKRGIVLRLGEVLFDINSYKLKKDSLKKLETVIDVLKKKYPDREIIVEGHTDITGSREYNMDLSMKRAKSVAGILKSRIDNDKLSFRGLGPDKPIADNKTKQGRQKNRRVEIIIKLD